MIKSSVEFNNTEYHNTTIQLKHAAAAEFTADNPILANGEMSIETDTNKFKFGDGKTHYNDLPYVGGGSSVGGFKCGQYSLSANQTSNFVQNNHVEFDTVVGDLPAPSNGVGQEKGIITLSAGKSYIITGALYAGFAGTCFSTQMYDRTNSRYFGKGMAVFSSADGAYWTSQPTVFAVIKPETDIEVELRFTVPPGIQSIEYYSSSLIVQEYGG